MLSRQCITGLNYNSSMCNYNFFPTLSLMIRKWTKRKCSLISGFTIAILFIAINTVGNSDFSYHRNKKKDTKHNFLLKFNNSILKYLILNALVCPTEFPNIYSFAEANMLSLMFYFC